MGIGSGRYLASPVPNLQTHPRPGLRRTLYRMTERLSRGMRPLVLAWMLGLQNVWRQEERYVAEFAARPVVRRVDRASDAEHFLARSFFWSLSPMAN